MAGSTDAIIGDNQPPFGTQLVPKPNPLQSLPHDLFSDRAQAELTNDGDNKLAFEPGRNPDAKTLYLLGMRDIIICMDNWKLANIDPSAVGAMLEAIFAETTKVETRGTAAH